jgi:2-methylcitrate dehydratase PrpD
MDQYFKPFAVCRWAQPAIAAALALRRKHDFPLSAIERIVVYTFHEAVCLATRRPQTTEEAQYSLPFPLAAALRYNQLGPNELSGAALQDRLILQLAERVQLIEDATYNSRFPEQRFARIDLFLADGTCLQSGEHQPAWDAGQSPSDDELQEKFRWLAGEVLPARRVEEIGKASWRLAAAAEVTSLANLLYAPPHNGSGARRSSA